VSPRILMIGAALVALPLALGLGGCSSQPSVGEIEEQIATRAQEQVSERGADITFQDRADCPDDAVVEPGQTFTCDLRGVEQGRNVVYTARVSVDDGGARFVLTDVREEGATGTGTGSSTVP